MVITRRLHWVLGRVLGRALDRQVKGDEEEALQRRGPTSSAHRQQTTTVVAEVVENVDNAANEPHDPVIEDVAGDSQGFPGGPQDTSMLTDYAYHVASKVWAGEVVICLIKTYLNKYLSF